MKFFADTANVKDIREAASWGILDGVTTNPSLLAKEGRDFSETIREICDIVNGPVNAEVISTESKGMVEEARQLVKMSEKIVVKIPMTVEGLKAIRILNAEGIRTNTTLCFTPTQCLMAAKAGTAYVSPFVGRLDDISEIGMDMIENTRTIFDNYGITAQILAASLRHPVHVLESALAGADIATMPFDVMKKLFNHPLTDIGLAKFLKDWQDAQAKMKK